MPSLPSKPPEDAMNADFANLKITIAVIHFRIIAMLIFRLEQSTFADSSRSLLAGKDMLATIVDGHGLSRAVNLVKCSQRVARRLGWRFLFGGKARVAASAT